MLAWLSHALAGWWGPLLLFDSYFFLASAGFAASAVSAFLLLHVGVSSVLVVIALKIR